MEDEKKKAEYIFLSTMIGLVVYVVLFCSILVHSVPIPLAPSDRSRECSGHGRVVDGKCECEDTFLGTFIYFFPSCNPRRKKNMYAMIQVIDVNYKWVRTVMVYLWEIAPREHTRKVSAYTERTNVPMIRPLA